MVLNKNNSKADLRQAIRIFGEISTWVVVPIIVALVLGKFLDTRYGTKPWIFLGLTILSFLVSIGGIAKILTKYIKEINEEVKNKNDRTDSDTK